MAEEKQKKNITVFGQETEFYGVLEFTDDLIITGKFQGTIKSTGNLEIAKGAICDVDNVTSKSLEIYGKLNGDAEASERIELCNGSSVHGNLKTCRIRIADGADYEGDVSMLESVSDVNLFSVSSDEYKQSMVYKSNEPK